MQLHLWAFFHEIFFWINRIALKKGSNYESFLECGLLYYLFEQRMLRFFHIFFFNHEKTDKKLWILFFKYIHFLLYSSIKKRKLKHFLFHAKKQQSFELEFVSHHHLFNFDFTTRKKLCSAKLFPYIYHMKKFTHKN